MRLHACASAFHGRRLQRCPCCLLQGKLDPEQRAALIERGKQIKEGLEGLEARLEALEAELQREGQRLPNMTHPGACGRRHGSRVASDELAGAPFSTGQSQCRAVLLHLPAILGKLRAAPCSPLHRASLVVAKLMCAAARWRPLAQTSPSAARRRRRCWPRWASAPPLTSR